MPQIEIRPTRETDIPLLMGINHSIETSHVWQMSRIMEIDQVAINFREVRLPRPVRIEYPKKPAFSLDDDPKQMALLTANMKDLAIGYLRLSNHYSQDSPIITDLVIGQSARRQGIASALVLSAHEWLISRNYRRVVLEMQSKNYPAICFAKKNGFEFCGYNDYYYENKDIALFFARSLR